MDNFIEQYKDTILVLMGMIGGFLCFGNVFDKLFVVVSSFVSGIMFR